MSPFKLQLHVVWSRCGCSGTWQHDETLEDPYCILTRSTRKICPRGPLSTSHFFPSLLSIS